MSKIHFFAPNYEVKYRKTICGGPSFSIDIPKRDLPTSLNTHKVTCEECRKSKVFQDVLLLLELNEGTVAGIIEREVGSRDLWFDMNTALTKMNERRKEMENESLNDERVAVIEVTPNWAGDLDMVTVDNALQQQGVDKEDLPQRPSRATAMRRAFDEVAPRGAKIDMLPKGLGVTMSLKNVASLDLGALAQAIGTEVRESNTYTGTLSVKIIVEKDSQGTEVETLCFTPQDHPMVEIIRKTYQVKRDQYKASEDLSQWFTQHIIPTCGGVSKRSRGGVYYVPATRKALMLKVAAALETFSTYYTVNREVGGKSFPVQILQHGGKLCMEPRASTDSAAMEILVDGIIRQTDGALDDMNAALSPDNGKKALGLRALKSKSEELASLEAQLASWESVCSVSLELLRNRIQETQSALAVAELAAEANDLQK